VAEVFEHAEGLVDNPDMGRVVPEFEQAYLRELIHPPLIFAAAKTGVASNAAELRR